MHGPSEKSPVVGGSPRISGEMEMARVFLNAKLVQVKQNEKSIHAKACRSVPGNSWSRRECHERRFWKRVLWMKGVQRRVAPGAPCRWRYMRALCFRLPIWRCGHYRNSVRLRSITKWKCSPSLSRSVCVIGVLNWLLPRTWKEREYWVIRSRDVATLDCCLNGLCPEAFNCVALEVCHRSLILWVLEPTNASKTRPALGSGTLEKMAGAAIVVLKGNICLEKVVNGRAPTTFKGLWMQGERSICTD